MEQAEGAGDRYGRGGSDASDRSSLGKFAWKSFVFSVLSMFCFASATLVLYTIFNGVFRVKRGYSWVRFTEERLVYLQAGVGY